jgi:hypothetical protein
MKAHMESRPIDKETIMDRAKKGIIRKMEAMSKRKCEMIFY